MTDETGHRAPGEEAEGTAADRATPPEPRSDPSSTPEGNAAADQGATEARELPSEAPQQSPQPPPNGRPEASGPGGGWPAGASPHHGLPAPGWAQPGPGQAQSGAYPQRREGAFGEQHQAPPLGQAWGSAPSGPGAPMPPFGQGAPGGPPGPGAPTGQWPGVPHHPGAPGPARRQRRGVPLWVLVVTVMFVALGSAGVGGVISGSLSSGASPEGERSGVLDNEVPSDAPSRAPDTIAGVAQRVNPSVVSIRGAGPQASGNGSGFVIADDFVVTNNHVAEAVERTGIEVVYSDGHVSEAEVVGSAPSSDLAVLRLADPINVEPLEFGDSDSVTVGDTVIAIGAPLGLDGTVTSGIISALDRPVTVGESGQEAYLNALQTDAAINPGNSGGPLVNDQGMVIGVNSAIATMGGGLGEQTGSIGLGFAIPSNQASRVVDQLIETGEAPHAVIGAVLDLTYQEPGARIIEDQTNGDTVLSDGPADEAGLRPGDVIVEFDGTPVSDSNQLVTLIRNKAPGDRVDIVYERDGAERETSMTLGSSTE